MGKLFNRFAEFHVDDFPFAAITYDHFLDKLIHQSWFFNAYTHIHLSRFQDSFFVPRPTTGSKVRIWMDTSSGGQPPRANGEHAQANGPANAVVRSWRMLFHGKGDSELILTTYRSRTAKRPTRQRPTLQWRRSSSIWPTFGFCRRKSPSRSLTFRYEILSRLLLNRMSG